ncbi:MAG TPA: VTC domain-containing protein [Kofleriaceae bacterium]|nr:VTC domain-containing protein [Kofleriaceae bacterium]
MSPEREYRFLLRRAEAAALLDLAAQHLQAVTYDRVRPVAYARTTYFDTAEGTYFRSTLEGPTRRRVRVREYAAGATTEDVPCFTGACFFERKESTGSARTKQRVAADAARIAELAAAERLRACLTTWYRRVTFAAADARVRLTMDEGISYARPATVPGTAGQPVPTLDLVEYGPSRVIEVKVVGEAPAWLAAVLDVLPADPDYSKFRMGMRALRSGRSPVGRATEPLEIATIPEVACK